MNEEDLLKIKNDVSDYPIEQVFGLYYVALDELERRMKNKK